MERSFRKIAIVSGGEAALRLLQAVDELNRSGAAEAPFETTAFHPPEEATAAYVQRADRAVAVALAGTSRRADFETLRQALVGAAVDAVWCGWGELAESAAFAALCEELGIVFLGPAAATLRRVGGRLKAKEVATTANVPVVPWSDGPVASVDEARSHVDRLGLPILVKSAAGSNGSGIARVDEIGELDEIFENVRASAREAGDDDGVLLERVVRNARHVSVPLVADDSGRIWSLGTRDGSAQRNRRKLVEEAPSVALPAELLAQAEEMAVRVFREADYRNIGSVEFLFDPRSQLLWFTGVDARLPTSHALIEQRYGIDLVKLQIRIAAGERLEDVPPSPRGHAVAASLSVERQTNSGNRGATTVERFRLPGGAGIRVDAATAEGDAVDARSGAALARIVAVGRDREEAIGRLERAVVDSTVLLRSGQSDKQTLLRVLRAPAFRGAEVGVDWIDDTFAELGWPPPAGGEIALLWAATQVYATQRMQQSARFYATAARGRPALAEADDVVVRLRHEGHRYEARVVAVDRGVFDVGIEGVCVRVARTDLDEHASILTVVGRRHRVAAIDQGLEFRIDLGGGFHVVAREDPAVIVAPTPAVVSSLNVRVGDEIGEGDRLALLEAMKLEYLVRAPFAGTIAEVFVRPNAQVDAGAPLLSIERQPSSRAVDDASRVRFDALATSGDGSLAASLAELRAFVLGFDVSLARMRRLLVEQRERRVREAATDPQVLRAEGELLEIIADVLALYRRHGDDLEVAPETARSGEHLITYLRAIETMGEGLPPTFVDKLRQALRHYGIDSLQPTLVLRATLPRLFRSHQRAEDLGGIARALLESRIEKPAGEETDERLRRVLDRLVVVAPGRDRALAELAREVRFRQFDLPHFEAAGKRVEAEMADHFESLLAASDDAERQRHLQILVACPRPLVGAFGRRLPSADPRRRMAILEVLTRRYYRMHELDDVRTIACGDEQGLAAAYHWEGKRIHLLALAAPLAALDQVLGNVAEVAQALPAEDELALETYVWRDADDGSDDELAQEIGAALERLDLGRELRRIVVIVCGPESGLGLRGVQHFTFRPGADGYREDDIFRGLHPMMSRRLNLWRLENFDIRRLPSVEDVYAFLATAKEHPEDERLIAIAEVRDLTPVRDAAGSVVQLPVFERMLMEGVAAIRRFRESRPPRNRPSWNRVLLYVWPTLDLRPDEIEKFVSRLAPATEGIGLEQIMVYGRLPDEASGELREVVIRIANPHGSGPVIDIGPPPTAPMRPLDAYEQRAQRLRQRGLLHPFEVVRMMTEGGDARRGTLPPGEFVEHDLDENNELVPVSRGPGENQANMVVGVIRSFTPNHPEGMARVILLGDPGRAMGALAEPECRRINKAIDLAESMGVPLEWIAVSAGAKISMESGTENMDWIAAVLRRLIEFTQIGGEVNVVVNGINVGAQPYWNAEATMLLHTRGILVMTPLGAMVLTGKQALDYSGSVSADDNFGIGGYERIMGPNGQAQYWAPDIREAIAVLYRHYEYTYVVPGETFPRRVATADPATRDVRDSPHDNESGEGFSFVGEIFSEEANPGRKRPFDIRSVLRAVVDRDCEPLERWRDMRDAEIAVIWDARLGGYAVEMIGIESHPLPRPGFVPADGPSTWTAGTLFPKASKKVARAVNAASDNRPLVILANLSGFDGSPDSLRELQLEFGAEIGRSVVNFRGPIVFCVVSRYHGGAYVVFSSKLNENIEAAALEGSFASVIGGAPAAAVVFAGEVRARTEKDPRIRRLDERIAEASGADRIRLRADREAMYADVYSEKLGEVAGEFDDVHSIQRALQVGSLHKIVAGADLRSYLIDAVGRGMRRWEEQRTSASG